ncbi:MAG: CaiB/BaiF CoA-transferase family protein [Deltaproteobacteria bacterium]|nr:CaiB/BaiF CoA-transferase family protein [Deltaproteobacteria bacterium]MDZ4341247.1 CaiB/BaiF CoA-transferase family protein [Candidatus Binatia bacterium]
MSQLPLEGIKVLELGHIVAGPTAGLILADLGADVIKIEDPSRGGDQSRSNPTGLATFYFLNRNKRSFAVNLKEPEGKELFLKFAASADVVLDNYAPGVLQRLGVDYDSVSEINPRIIQCSINGFLKGPYARRPALDEVAQMMGGIAFMTGLKDQPMRIGASVTDISVATYAVIGILSALFQRNQTGRGQRLTSGLFETVVFWVGQHMSSFAVGGEPSVPMPVRRMGTRFRWGVFDLFRAADGKQVFIGITSNRHWETFCREFGQSELGAHPNLQNNEARTRARDWLIPRVQEIAGSYESNDLMGKLENAEVPYAPVNSPADLYEDPYLMGHENRLLPVEAGQKTVRLPALPFESEEFQFSVRRQPPRLGEHSREILQELGLSDADIDRLAKNNVVMMA